MKNKVLFSLLLYTFCYCTNSNKNLDGTDLQAKYVRLNKEYLLIDSFLAKQSLNEAAYWQSLFQHYALKKIVEPWFKFTKIVSIKNLNIRIYYCKENLNSDGMEFIILKNMENKKLYYIGKVYYSKYEQLKYPDLTIETYGINNYINESYKLSEEVNLSLFTGKVITLDKEKKMRTIEISKELDSLLIYTVVDKCNLSDPKNVMKIINKEQLHQFNLSKKKEAVIEQYVGKSEIYYNKTMRNRGFTIISIKGRYTNNSGIDGLTPYIGSFSLSVNKY